MKIGQLKRALALALLLGPALPLFAQATESSAPAGQESQLHEDLALPYLLRMPSQTGPGRAAPLILLLHGMGSNEDDLFALRDAFPANFAVASARAPIRLGENRFEWFEATRKGNELDGKQAQLRAAAAGIRELADQLVKRYGLDERQVYLVGFSQGAIMSYEAALPHPDQFKGIAVMSGSLFKSLVPDIRRGAELSKLRVFISHGNDDPRIPVVNARLSAKRLASFGGNAETHLYSGMGHEINDEALGDLVHWLQAGH